MFSIGIFPSLQSKPYQLDRLVREHNLQEVNGNHLHLVSASMKNPQVVKHRKVIVRSIYNWTPGGSAA